MAFMSGTLESLLLFSNSNQTRGGEPVYSMSQSQELQCTDSRASIAGSSSHHGQTGKVVYNQAGGGASFSKSCYMPTQESRYNQALNSLTGDSTYSSPQCIDTGEPAKAALSRSQSEEDGLQQMQEGKLDHLNRDQPYMKIGDRLSRGSSTASERLCSTEEETWESLACMETDQDNSVWTISPAMPKSVEMTLTGNGSDKALSAVEDSSGRHLCSSSSLQDVFESDEAGGKSFVTREESRKTSRSQSTEKPSTSCDYKARLDLSSISSPTSSLGDNISDSKMLNDQCFQAAISEGFGNSSQTLTYKVRPVKRFSYHTHSNRLHNVKQVNLGQLGHMHNKCQWEQGSSPHADFISMSLADTLNTVKTGSACQQDSQDNLSSDSSSQNSKKDFFDKKYRYNHTALALQQSGLMKTTIKTAEILRRGKILQAELNKLGKETAVFMRSVLSNPENQHFRELYMKLHNSKIIN